MNSTIAVLVLAALALLQSAGQPQPGKRAPRLGFVQAKDVSPIIDTDVFDEAKYVEESGSDSSAVKAKRTAHEAALNHEFMDGFNQARECDRVIFMGKGDQKPDFELQIMVDSHDTPGQKPVWEWVLRDLRSNKLMPVGNDDSGQQAAKNICLAVQKAIG